MSDYKKLIRTKNAKKNHLRMQKNNTYIRLAPFLFTSALIIGLLFVATYFLFNFSGFKVTKVSVIDTAGVPFANQKGIFYLSEDLNLFSFDMQRIVQDIETRHPEFISVRLRKQFPDTIVIIVKKRKPVAILGMQKSYLVDAEGFILPYESKYQDLPKIVGARPGESLYTHSASLRLHKALDLLKELKNANIYPANNVSRIDLQSYSEVVFYLDNGIEVKMGQSNFDKKALLLKGIIDQVKASKKIPQYIDMRFDNPTVMP